MRNTLAGMGISGVDFNGLIFGKPAAGIVGAAVEVAISAVAEDEGAAALGTDARSNLDVGITLGGVWH